jgi:hypothetical protein
MTAMTAIKILVAPFVVVVAVSMAIPRREAPVVEGEAVAH